VCRWLTETFHLTPADARARDSWAMSFAVANGQRSVCVWLAHTFELRAADVHKVCYHNPNPAHYQWLADALGCADVQELFSRNFSQC